MTRSDARKRREEADPVDPAQRAMELLADAVACAVRNGIIEEPLTQIDAGLLLDFNSLVRLAEFYKILDTRLEPF